MSGCRAEGSAPKWNGAEHFWINYESVIENSEATRVGETKKVQKSSGRGKAYPTIGHEGQDRE
jgi:hypothetical protein